MPDSNDSAFFYGSPKRLLLAVLVSLAALAQGCSPKIGDDCSVSTNCSISGDRLCDITQPGGYCTVFNCEPGRCPKDSVCVNFGVSLSVSGECRPSQGVSPYERSFCMAECGSDGDCRAGYECLSVNGDPNDAAGNQLRAVLAEHQGGARVCAVPPNPAPVDPETGVCDGSDAGPPLTSGGGAGGMSGGGAAGEGGESGEGGSSGDGGAAP